jgi:hypothetical protein
LYKRYFYFEKGSGTQRVTQKFDWRGVMLVIPMPGKSSGTPFRRPSENELPERRIPSHKYFRFVWGRV